MRDTRAQTTGCCASLLCCIHLSYYWANLGCFGHATHSPATCQGLQYRKQIAGIVQCAKLTIPATPLAQAPAHTSTRNGQWLSDVRMRVCVCARAQFIYCICHFIHDIKRLVEFRQGTNFAFCLLFVRAFRRMTLFLPSGQNTEKEKRAQLLSEWQWPQTAHSLAQRPHSQTSDNDSSSPTETLIGVIARLTRNKKKTRCLLLHSYECVILHSEHRIAVGREKYH